MNEKDLKVFGFVLISSYRRRVVDSLSKHDMTPTEIAQDSGIRINHISKVLRELKNKNIVVCTNDEQKKNRNFQLTKLGTEIAEELKK